MKKKILTALFIMALCIFTFGIVSASAETYGDLTYYISNGKVTITACRTFAAGELVIPDTLNGYPVTSIGDSAFYYCRSLSRIRIPDSVTSIGDKAFYNCISLSIISIPDGVTSIGDEAFRSCSNLSSINIPDSVTSIGDKAFGSCGSLSSVSIGNGVTSIGYGAFSYCISLSSVSIGNGVTSIGRYAFESCSSLKSVYITDIDAWCRIKFVDYYSNPLYYANNLYLNGSLVTDVIIPSGVTSINYTFSNCSSLKSISIPDSVTSIGRYAFRGCSSLSDITVDKNNAYYTLRDSVLFDKNVTELICYPAGKTDSSCTIPDSVTSIGDYAFYKCSSLSSINIPDSVTSIGDYAFYKCSSLSSVSIGNGVTSIGGGAFYYCSSLSSINIPDSVTSIGDDAFSNCSSLKTVYYNGDQDNWNKISIGSYNDPLKNATKKFFFYVTIIDGDGSVLNKKIYDLDGNLDFSDFEEKSEHTIHLYTDSEYKNELTTMVTENYVTLYLRYIPIQYHTKFIDYDGSVIWEGLIDYDAVITLPENPKRDNTQQYTYTFTGWNGYSEGITQTNSEMVFKAEYSAELNQYTYKFIDKDGTVINSEKVDYGTVITAPEMPDKEPYIFDYWENYTNGMAVTDNITFTAVYKYKDYFITAEGLNEEIKVTYNSDFVITPQERKDYYFIGYFTEQDGKGTQITNENGESLNAYNVVGDLAVYPYFESIYLNKIAVGQSISVMPGDEFAQEIIFATNYDIMCLTTTLKYPEYLNFESVLPLDFVEVYCEPEKVKDGYKYLEIMAIYNYEGDNVLKNKKYVPFEVRFSVPGDAPVGDLNIDITDAILSGDSDYEFEYMSGSNITILPKLAESIAIIGSNEIDGPAKFTAVISPDYTTNKSVLWTVSDESVATISEDGVLTPVKNGSVTIFATAKDGSGVFARKDINVIAYAKITGLDFGDGVAAPEFNPNIRKYTVYVAEDTAKIYLTPLFTGGVLRPNGSGIWLSGRVKEFSLNETGSTIITLNRENVSGMTNGEYIIEVVRFEGAKTFVSSDKKSFTIAPLGVEEGKTIVLALYNGDNFVEMKHATYDGEKIFFTTDKEYTNAKVFVWNDLENITPAYAAEIVK